MPVEELDHKFKGLQLERPRQSPVDLLESVREHRPERPWLSICAPMVRYSKLPFRDLIRSYDVDVCFSQMIVADVFKHSEISRAIDWLTNSQDDPIIVQFGASNSKDIADCAQLVAPYCNGVDINCGCPQKWAIGEGIGSALMRDAEKVSDMIDQVKRRTSPLHFPSSTGTGFPCSVKIRVHKDIRQTVEFAQRAEKAGADWISVHGRTQKQRSSEPPDFDAIRIVKESVSIPVFSNGDCFSLDDAYSQIESTGCDGIMSARGLQQNPALFAGYAHTPAKCIKQYLDLALGYGQSYYITHHHLIDMLDKTLSRAEKRHFNSIPGTGALIDYLEDHFQIY